jgi:beta-lactamase regulating signal transducer with metallopeptidase domain
MDWFLTWVWHGVALALLVSGALRACRRVRASARYLVWWAALAGVVALGWTGVPGAATVSGEALRSAAAAPGPFVLALPPLPSWLEISLLGAWTMLAAVGLGRLAAAMIRLRQQRRGCRPISTDRERRLPLWLSTRGDGRRTRLMVSDAVPVASVLGFVRPIIVLPRRLLAAVTDHQLDQIVLHEHAHVQRWDDWGRLAQGVVEAVFPFHPAVRWIGRSLDLEREIACDEGVVARTGAPRSYAGCLTRIAEWTTTHPARAVAPGIHGTGRTLVPRVERLLAPRPYGSRTISTAALAAGVSLVAVAVLQLRLMPPFITERAVSAALVIEQPAAVAVSLVSDVRPQTEPDRRPVAQPATEVTVAVPVVAPVAVPLVATAPVEATTEAAVPLLSSTTLTPPTGAAIGPVSLGEVSRIDEPRPAGYDLVERAVLDSRNAWQKAADAGVAYGAGAQESSLAIASAFTRLGRSLGRAF